MMHYIQQLNNVPLSYVHDLPQEVIVQLGWPPAGHRFIRVASDILLIAEGTGIFVDAIQDSSEN